MKKAAGVALILGGCLVLIVEIPSLDDVVATISWQRGIHLSDVLGLLIVAAGITVMWRP